MNQQNNWTTTAGKQTTFTNTRRLFELLLLFSLIIIIAFMPTRKSTRVFFFRNLIAFFNILHFSLKLSLFDDIFILFFLCSYFLFWSCWFCAEMVNLETTRVNARFSARRRSFSALYFCSCCNLRFFFRFVSIYDFFFVGKKMNCIELEENNFCLIRSTKNYFTSIFSIIIKYLEYCELWNI